MSEPRCVCPYCGTDLPEAEGGVRVIEKPVEKPANVCRDPYCFCPSLEALSNRKD